MAIIVFKKPSPPMAMKSERALSHQKIIALNNIVFKDVQYEPK
jgi:hypothetical protein